MTYDASRCADPAAAEALRAWDMVVAPDLRFLFAAGRPSRAVVEQALVQEEKLPADSQPWWVCRSGIGAMTNAMKGQAGPLKLKPVSAWPSLREAARMPLIKAQPVK